MYNRFFTFVVGSVLTFGVVGAAIAQNNALQPPQKQDQSVSSSSHNAPARQLQRLNRVLNLTPDQQSQIKPILVNRQQELDALFMDQQLSQGDRSAKAKSIVADAHSKIEALLTAEQKPKFKPMLQHIPTGNEE